MRLIRLVRIVKLYKQAKLAAEKREQAQLAKLKEEQAAAGLKEDDPEVKVGLKRLRNISDPPLKKHDELSLENLELESKISKTLSDKITRIVICIILGSLFILPLFARKTYYLTATSYEVGLSQLMVMKERSDSNVPGAAAAYDSAYNFYINDLDKNEGLALIKLIIPGKPTWNAKKGINDYRIDEFNVAEGENGSAAYYDISLLTKLEAGISIARTILVCMLLGCGTYFFNKDANVLVL